MRWVIQSSTFSAGAASYVQWQIRATPTYAVCMFDSGIWRPLIEADPLQGNLLRWSIRAQDFTAPAASYQQVQITGTPTYGVYMMHGGRLLLAVSVVARATSHAWRLGCPITEYGTTIAGDVTLN